MHQPSTGPARPRAKTMRIIAIFPSQNPRREIMTLQCGHTINRAKSVHGTRRRTVCPVCN
jgi:hypothetical protein